MTKDPGRPALSTKEIAGSVRESLLPGFESEALEAVMRQVLGSGVTAVLEFRAWPLADQHREHAFAVSFFCLTDADGRPQGCAPRAWMSPATDGPRAPRHPQRGRHPDRQHPGRDADQPGTGRPRRSTPGRLCRRRPGGVRSAENPCPASARRGSVVRPCAASAWPRSTRGLPSRLARAASRSSSCRDGAASGPKPTSKTRVCYRISRCRRIPFPRTRSLESSFRPKTYPYVCWSSVGSWQSAMRRAHTRIQMRRRRRKTGP